MNNGNYYTGKQNHTGKRGASNAVRYGMNTKSGSLSGSGGFNGTVLGRNPNTSSTRLSGSNTINGAVSRSRTVSGESGATGTRNSVTREATVLQQNQNSNAMQGTRVNRGATISNLRRSGTNNIQSSGPVNPGNMTRPVSAGRDYTPTYTRPRMNTQPSYNTGATRQYSTPQTNSGGNQSTRFARPQSSGSTFNGAVRNQQSNSYQRGPASNSSTRSSVAPDNSSGRSSSPSYSSPSPSSTRTYSAPASSSFGGGNTGGSVGSGGGGSSGGGHTGGGGGSGRTR
jgi:hypothetical protein